MAKCKICNKSLGIFSTKNICDICNNSIINDLKTLIAKHDILNNDYKKKGKKLSHYIETSIELIKIQEELEQINKVAPHIVYECESSMDYINRLKNNIIDHIDTQISIIKEKNSINDSSKELNKDLKKLFEEVSECKINYELFADILLECQNKIKEELK